MNDDVTIDAAHIEWPRIPGPHYAIIHVQYEQRGELRGEAWPIVERVPGGWQSGSHHYPDDAVLDVRPLALVDPSDTRTVQRRAAEVMLAHAIDPADVDVDGNTACVCGYWRDGDPGVCEGWDDHLAEALADVGLLADLERAGKLREIVGALTAEGLDPWNLTRRQQGAIVRLRELTDALPTDCQ